MKEIILSIVVLFSGSLCIEGQSNDAQRASTRPALSYEHEEECGSPLVESMLWMSVEGTVIKVIDGDSIILLTKDNERKRVNLVAIDSSAAKDFGRRLLSRLVLNRIVSVLVNPSDIKRRTIVGVVHGQEKDVNRELLEAGAARFREPAAYSVSDYTACGYRIVERKAREAKKGLWQSASR